MKCMINYLSKKRCTANPQANLNNSHVRELLLENLKGTKVCLANVPPEKAEFIPNLEVTYEQMLEIELNTWGQASCDRWYDERKNRITGFKFWDCGKKEKIYFSKVNFEHTFVKYKVFIMPSTL